MRLTINLATRRYINLRRLNALLVACFLLLGTLLVFKVREVAYNQAELTRIRQLSASSGARPGQTASAAQLQALSARIRFANGLIEKKTTNWLSLLNRLEEVVPDGVSLTQLEPSQREQLLKVNGAARNFASLRTFVENLEQSENFSEVYLLSQNEKKVGLTQQGIDFAITCKVTY